MNMDIVVTLFEHCSFPGSVNYTLVREYVREWEESGGKIKWRKDRRCGSEYLLPDGNTQ